MFDLRRSLFFLLVSTILLHVSPIAFAEPAVRPKTEPAPAKSEPSIDTDELYSLGKSLFDEYAPPEIKKDYEFPSQQQWNDFTTRLQKALNGGSLEELAEFEPEARRAYTLLQAIPDATEYADWLAERLDLIESAQKAIQTPAPKPPPSPRKNDRPPEVTAANEQVPYYDLWLNRLRDRPRPARADEFVPLLKTIFTTEGLPSELAWLAEVESSLNPAARSPAGARGLFQLMPATARSLGLSLLPSDERTQPRKNAQAAAKMLRSLYTRFESWPLALAAYNCGETRIAALLKKGSAPRFAEICGQLPAETRMYVPKVLATLAVRENAPWQKWP
jgi:membrane-bound lytic murein transglycosylase D